MPTFEQWNEKTGVDALDNPVAGTPLDPNRRMWMRGLMQPQTQTQPQPQTQMPEVPTQDAASADAQIAPVAAPSPGPVASPQSAGPGVNLSSTSDSNASPEDALFQRIMSQNMDDTPSNSRIQQLQGEMDARHQKPSLKQRLITLGVMAAPTLIGGIAGGAEGAGAAAGGTLEAENTLHERHEHDDQILRGELESERGRQERQFERRLQLPVSYMNMRMMRDYRQGMLQLGQNKLNVNHQDAMTRLGLDQNGQPVPEDQLPLKTRQQVLQSRAHMDLYRSQGALADAKEELASAQNDPNSPAFGLARDKVRAAMMQAKAAQDRADAMGLGNKVREAQYYKSAFGTDMEGDVLPGGFEDPNTHTPMGWNAPGNPVSGIKYRGQTANEVMTRMPEVEKSIDAVSDKEIGMLSGHFNEWWSGKWGADNPRLSALRTNLMLADTAMMLSHVGQSGGVEMMDHFKSLLNLGQSRGNLKANLGEIKGWLSGYAEQGTPNAPTGTANPNFKRVTGGAGTDIPAPKGAGKLAKPQHGGGGQVIHWGKDPKTGRPVPVPVTAGAR